MPDWLYAQLKRGPTIRYTNKIGHNGQLVQESSIENEISGLVPVLAQLCSLSEDLQTAYFCHPGVQHIFKRKYHGGFCGYLNIQMQISYIQGARSSGHESFGKSVPGILDIQNIIEHAWDMGIYAHGRVATGGLKGTRKWIGTPEVCIPAHLSDLELYAVRRLASGIKTDC